jgi:hypothetical protein
MSATFRIGILLIAAFTLALLTMNQTPSVGQETLRIVERWEYRIESGSDVNIRIANQVGSEGLGAGAGLSTK